MLNSKIENMMKKITYYLGIAAITLGGLASCTLDAESYVEKSPENFPKNEDDISQALTGIYANLNTVAANPQMSFLYAAQLASDDALGGGGPNDGLMQADDLLMNYTTDATNQFYIDRYNGIKRTNGVISTVENLTDLDETVKNKALGEAKFFRGFFYYELASMYGCVCLNLSTDEQQMTQPTAAELWGQILQDLYEATSLLPAERNTNGRIDKYGAEAMLGRAWLFYTGMYCNGDDIASLTSTTYNPLTTVALPNGTTLTKQMVSDLIDDCVNNSGYSLVNDYRNLWAYTNRCTVNDYAYTAGATDKDGNALVWAEDDNAVNPETLFAIKFNKMASWNTTIGFANEYALHFGARGNACFPFGSGWGAGPVAPNLVSDWKAAEPNDIRLEATVQTMSELEGFELGGGGEYVQETGYYGKKWSPIMAKAKDNDGNEKTYNCFETVMYGATGWEGGEDNLQLANIHDLVLIRFADVLLMQSELKESVTGINLVRERAGLDPIASYSLTALQNERRWELAMEGIRWNDIRRWHIAAAALSKQQNVKCYYNGNEDTNTAHGGGYAARYNATAGFFKIPETQVSLSEGGIQQNAGYESSDSQYNTWLN